MLLRNGLAKTLLAICFLAGVRFEGAEKAITLGFIMDQATDAERAPLRAYLTKAMGRPVIIAAPDSSHETVTHLGEGSYDFACLGALMYIRAHAQYGVIPLVQRDIDQHFHTVFIARADSSIHSLNDLSGKQFAFGDIDSASGHLVPYLTLRKVGIDPETDFHLRYSGSHPATAAMVEAGVVDAGALDEAIFKFLIGSGRIDGKKVLIFHTSESYVDYVYVARKDLPPAERARFVHALLALKAGKDDSILNALHGKRFVLANDEEYAELRRVAHELKMF